MIHAEIKTGQSFHLPHSDVASGQVIGDFNLVVLRDGELDGGNASVALSEPVPSIYDLAFTFATPGQYAIVLDGTVKAYVTAVSRASHEMLENIEDVSLGSWQWDKSNGTLVMLDQNGDVLANFEVTDNGTVSSRERV